MKQTITQWLYMRLDHKVMPNGDYDWASGKVWHPIVKSFCDKGGDADTVYIGPVEIGVEIPDDFDPTAHEIAALNEKKRKATEAYQGLVSEINERISKLQAIGYEGPK